MRQYETYKCQKCGNEVEVQNVGGGTLSCCGAEMTCITTDLTAVNLMKAFAGESMARNKYDLFADVAQEEGWHQWLRILEKRQKMKNGTQEQSSKPIIKLSMARN